MQLRSFGSRRAGRQFPSNQFLVQWWWSAPVPPPPTPFINNQPPKNNGRRQSPTTGGGSWWETTLHQQTVLIADGEACIRCRGEANVCCSTNKKCSDVVALFYYFMFSSCRQPPHHCHKKEAGSHSQHGSQTHGRNTHVVGAASTAEATAGVPIISRIVKRQRGIRW